MRGNIYTVIIVQICFLLVGCSSSRHATSYPSEKPKSKALNAFLKSGSEKELNTSNTNAKSVINTAKTFMGAPHCMGKKKKKCTDCSGLVYASFKANNVNMPRTAEQQAPYGNIIWNKNQLREGDLVFFINTYKTSKYITHVGIYLGNGKFIHTSSKKGVSITTLDNVYWKEKYVFGTRVF